MVGTLLRYLVLFPIRFSLLLVGFLLCMLGFLVVQIWYAMGFSCRSCGHANKMSAESSCVRIFASSFVVSWSGVVRYHGIRPSDTMQKRVFVANHSSMIDVAIVLQRDNYSLVGQQHKGWIAFVQNKILASLHCVWFQRGEARDRNAVFQKLQKHARNEEGNLPVSSSRVLAWPSSIMSSSMSVRFLTLFFLPPCNLEWYRLRPASARLP